MTTLAPLPRLDPDSLAHRRRQRRLLISGGIAALLLAGPLGSVGGSSEGVGTWSATVEVLPEVRGAAVALVALTWLVCRWQQRDVAFVERLQRLVLWVVWSTFVVALVAAIVALTTWAPGGGMPFAVFPVELVVVRG